MNADCIFIILTIWSKLFLINLFSIYMLEELLLGLQSRITSLGFQAIFQTKPKNLSFCRTVLSLDCSSWETSLVYSRDRHTSVHTFRQVHINTSLSVHKMELGLYANWIVGYNSPLNRGCSSRVDFDHPCVTTSCFCWLTSFTLIYIVRIILFSTMKVIC